MNPNEFMTPPEMLASLASMGGSAGGSGNGASYPLPRRAGANFDTRHRRLRVDEALKISTSLFRLMPLTPGTNAQLDLKAGDPNDPVALFDLWFSPNDYGGLLLRISNSIRFKTKWGEMNQEIQMIHRPIHFGGMRWYFLCPGRKGMRPCHRRTLNLYLPPEKTELACSRCYDLGYLSSQKSSKKKSAILAAAKRLMDQAAANRTSVVSSP